jgi:hypothetical protein
MAISDLARNKGNVSCCFMLLKIRTGNKGRHAFGYENSHACYVGQNMQFATVGLMSNFHHSEVHRDARKNFPLSFLYLSSYSCQPDVKTSN